MQFVSNVKIAMSDTIQNLKGSADNPKQNKSKKGANSFPDAIT